MTKLVPVPKNYVLLCAGERKRGDEYLFYRCVEVLEMPPFGCMVRVYDQMRRTPGTGLLVSQDPGESTTTFLPMTAEQVREAFFMDGSAASDPPSRK